MLTLEHSSLRVVFGKRSVKLSPRSFDILRLLLRTPGIVSSKRQLAREIWGTEAVTDGAINQALSLLRHELGDLQVAIRCVRSRGYCYEPDALTSATMDSEPVEPGIDRASLTDSAARTPPAELNDATVQAMHAATPILDLRDAPKTRLSWHVQWKRHRWLSIFLAVVAIGVVFWFVDEPMPARSPSTIAFLDADESIEPEAARAILASLSGLTFQHPDDGLQLKIEPASELDTLAFSLTMHDQPMAAIEVRDAEFARKLPGWLLDQLVGHGLKAVEVSAASNPDVAKRFASLARQQRNDGEWAAAVEQYIQAADADPQDSGLRLELAALLMERGSARSARLWASTVLIQSTAQDAEQTRARALIAESLDRHLDRFLELGKLPPTASTELERVDALIRVGNYDQAVQMLHAADVGNEPDLLVRKAIAEGDLARFRGDVVSASEIFRRCAAHMEELSQTNLQGRCLLRLGYVSAESGDLPAAKIHLRNGLALARQLPVRRFDGTALLLYISLRRGEPCEGLIADSDQLLEVAAKLGDPYSVAVAQQMKSGVDAGCGDLSAAYAAASRAVAVAKGSSDPWVHAATLWNLVELELERGNVAAAAEHWKHVRALSNTNLEPGLVRRLYAYLYFSGVDGAAEPESSEAACWKMLVMRKVEQRQSLLEQCRSGWRSESEFDIAGDRHLADLLRRPTVDCSDSISSGQYDPFRYGSKAFRLRALCTDGPERAPIVRWATATPP